jgi:hypothetical protein
MTVEQTQQQPPPDAQRIDGWWRSGDGMKWQPTVDKPVGNADKPQPWVTEPERLAN